MIDTHCHLDFQAFEQDRATVIERSKLNGVTQIVVPAVSAATFKQTIKVCQQYSELELALGLHPIFIKEHQPQDLNELDELITKHRPIAVGEIGLDFFQADLNNDKVKEKQTVFFTKQLIIAKQHKLPVIIHNRKAHDLCINVLTKIGSRGGIIHAFNGSIQQAHKYIELGFVLGFGGMLTFERSSKLRNLAKQIPLESIVLETDAPDMTVAQHKGERNSPEYLPFIQQALASTKQLSPDTIAQVTSANAKRVLNI